MIERPRRVVLLIDYDNLQICASRDTPGRELQLTPVVQLAQRFGTVIQARAYAEWNLSTERLAVYKAGIEPAFAPVLRTESDRSGKSLADTVMVAEGMDMLWTLSPDVVVLATSDKDLIPLARVAKQRGAHVVVLGSDFTAIPLREMADEHFTYRQLITDASGRITGGDATSGGRQPAPLPDSGRRRSRDRAGRGERAPTTTTTPPAPATAQVTVPAPAPSPSRTERPQERAPERTEHGERAERGERVEREGAAAAPEAVAPVAAGTPSDADAQSSGRRRRRRGSRRRTDRLGLTGDTEMLAGEPGGADFDPEISDAAEVTPTSNLLDVAEASGGTLEEHSRNGAAPASPAETTDVPAPRERRRRTRRTTTPAATAASEPVTDAAQVATPETDAGHGPTAGETPGPIEPEPAPVETSVPDGDGITSGPRPRRRVTSAGRTRSRRT